MSPDLSPEGDLGSVLSVAKDKLKHLCSYVEQPRQNGCPSVFSQARLGGGQRVQAPTRDDGGPLLKTCVHVVKKRLRESQICYYVVFFEQEISY